jgi:dTDP-4-dehydrorhamnose reductase
MKLLLLGKHGQVGTALQATLAGLGEVTALGRAEADLEQPGELPRLVTRLAPDVIVNAAAYTAVDKAAEEPDRARLVNAEAVATLAAAAQRCGAWLIHYSTDFVFDGRKADPYVESDEPNPLSIYGATKHKGDLAVAASGCRHLIFRVSWVFGDGHGNFPRAILRLARDRTSLNVVADQIGAPTSASLIAEITAAAIARLAGADAEGLAGTYHLAPSGAVDRHALAQFVVAEALANRAVLALRPENIAAIASSDYPSPAVRPLNSRLDCSKLRATFGVDLPDWRDHVRRFVAGAVAGGTA